MRSRCSYEHPRKTRTLSRRQAPCSAPACGVIPAAGVRAGGLFCASPVIRCPGICSRIASCRQIVTDAIAAAGIVSYTEMVERTERAGRERRSSAVIFALSGDKDCTFPCSWYLETNPDERKPAAAQKDRADLEKPYRRHRETPGNDRGEPGISPVIGDGRSQDIEIHTGFQKSSKDIRLFRIMADPGSHRLSCKGGSKTLAAERREVEGQPRILPPACRSFPIRKEKRASPVRACIFGAAGALRLFGLHRFFKRGDEKARKARSAQPVSKDKERNHGYGHICKSSNQPPSHRTSGPASMRSP